jgi:hypothetical protein
MMEPRDLVVTVPAKLWFNWLCEGDLPVDPHDERGTWDFYTSRTPRGWQPGQRVYVIAHGYLRGYSELVSANQTALVRSGPGVACTLLKDGKPKPMLGFQGWRYATGGRQEVVGWEGVHAWATFGLSPKLSADVENLLALRRTSPDVRAAIRSASLTAHMKSMRDVTSMLRIRTI